MAQGRVTDYFATRKRTRFNQDETVVLNKQKKTQKLVDSSPGIETFDEIKMLKKKLSMISTSPVAAPSPQETRCLRSKAKLQEKSDQASEKVDLP